MESVVTVRTQRFLGVDVRDECFVVRRPEADFFCVGAMGFLETTSVKCRPVPVQKGRQEIGNSTFGGR